MESRKVRLARLYRFSAAHRLYSSRLAKEENLHLFGKCGRPAGHGHNYHLKVVVEGAVDPVTGMVIDLARLDRIVDRHVLAEFDHRNLNDDVGLEPVPTSEMLAVEIWKRLEPHLKKPRLVVVEIEETRKNLFSYEG